MPDIRKALRVAIRLQTAADHGKLACGLRRSLASRRQFRENLDELAPSFATRVPTNLFDGKLPRYQRLAPDRFRPYSIGWNSRDDGGEPKKERAGSNRWKADRGDWVWGSSGNGPGSRLTSCSEAYHSECLEGGPCSRSRIRSQILPFEEE